MQVTGPTTDHNEIRRWATIHSMLPTELLPERVDHVPVEIALMGADKARKDEKVIIIGWEEFFQKFDLLGLSFVYGDEPKGYHELLQIDSRSPYLHPDYRPVTFQN